MTPSPRTRRQGAPGATRRREGNGRLARRMEEREVRAADPQLSPDTNARLTQELRAVVGAERVAVPIDRPHVTRGERPRRPTLAMHLNQHRVQLIQATVIMITFGAIVSLITGNWWLLPLAAGVHALGTMTVTMSIIGITTITEHPAPDIAAAMAEDGVASPDERFSEMVDEFRAVPRGGAGDVLSPGHDERTADDLDDPLTAGAEQSAAMTATGSPSPSAGEGGTPDVIIWTTAILLLVLSIALPPFFGSGWMWLLPAVMVPLVVAWMVMERMMITRAGQLQITGRRPLVAIVLCTVIAVAVFCGVVALAYTSGGSTPHRTVGTPINASQ